VLTGKEVNYEKQAEFEVIGLRRTSAAYRPILDINGTTSGWLALVEDITDRSE